MQNLIRVSIFKTMREIDPSGPKGLKPGFRTSLNFTCFSRKSLERFKNLNFFPLVNIRDLSNPRQGKDLYCVIKLQKKLKFYEKSLKF